MGRPSCYNRVILLRGRGTTFTTSFAQGVSPQNADPRKHKSNAIQLDSLRGPTPHQLTSTPLVLPLPPIATTTPTPTPTPPTTPKPPQKLGPSSHPFP